MKITKMRKSQQKKNKSNKIKMHFLENISTLDTTNEESPKSVNEITKAKLISGEYKFFNKDGRSKIWETFAKIEDDNGKEMEGVVGCKICFSIYKFDRSTSNLVKHRCYLMGMSKINNCPDVEVDVETIKRGIHIITEWTVKNGRPLSIIDDSGLKDLAEFLITVGATYGQHVNIDKLLPHRTTISRNISKLYEFHFEEIRNEIVMFTKFGYSITSDIWTDNHLKTSYLYLMMHYIKDGALINRLLAVKSMEGVSCTGDEIKGIINEVLHEFGCDLEKDNPTIVSERDLGLNNIHCVNHLLHNAIERTINKVPELLNMVNSCSKIVEYFKESGMKSNLEIALKSYCPTRWNTVYHLFKSIETNWLEISKILDEKNEIFRMQEIDLSNLRSVINLLAPFETSSKKLESNKYPTLHLAIPYINHLKKVCRVDINDGEIIQKCKSVLLHLLQSMVQQNFIKSHNIALFLFPPTNKLSQFTETEKEQTIYDCWEVMKTFINDSTTENLDWLSPSTPGENEIFADFCQPCHNNVYDNGNEEIQRYKNVNIAFSEDFNILQWWSNNKDQFPYLYKTSCKILAVPASSAASEKVFSTIKNLISDKRHSIVTNEDMINKIMFLHSNIDELNENILDA